MSEPITLPRSGVVMTQDKNCRFPSFIVTAENMRFRVERITVNGARWHATSAVTLSSGAYGDGTNGTREECIAWLDSRVVALRAALMPADARERVRKVLDWPALADVDVDDMADAILAALGIGGVR